MAINTSVDLRAFARVPGSAGMDERSRVAPETAIVVPPGGGGPLLVGPKMRPRDEVIFWLSAAAEIEHALMAQYLFAAYSIDPESLPAGTDAERQARDIKNRLLQISREEMGHLITVQNLLHVVGGPLHFGRQFSPFEAAIQPFRYRLEPFTLDSAAKYVIAEMPNRRLDQLTLRPNPADDAAIKAKLAGDISTRARRSNGDVDLWHVGAVFKRLTELFQTELSDMDLRIDRLGLQARWADWGYQAPPRTDGVMVLVETVDGNTAAEVRQRAVDAIKKIGDQGEASDATTDRDESHFERFLAIYEKLEQVEAALGRPLALPVAPNPNTTRPPPATDNVPLSMGQDHLDVGRITEERALRWADLFNIRYRILLDCLQHSLLLDTAPYEGSGDRTPKGLLQYWTFSEMRRIKKIAEKLVELPKDRQGGQQGVLRAGPPFELPYSLRLPSRDTDRWAGHADVFAMAKAFIEQQMLVNGETGTAFLRSLAEADGLAAAIADALVRGAAVPAGTHATDFRKAVRTLDEAVRGFPITAPHGPFWRDKNCAALIADRPGRIVPGDPAASELIDRVGRDQSDGLGMPRERPRIPHERVDFLKDWIAGGARDNVPAGEIGIASEPVPPREPAVVVPPQPPVTLSFARDIKPLFRDRDRNRMLFRFDLFVFDDVKQNANDILDSVSTGRMPCDTPWDSSKVATFKKWIDGGMLA
jgi:Ferritin-like